MTGISTGRHPRRMTQTMTSAENASLAGESGNRSKMLFSTSREKSLYEQLTSVSVGPLCSTSRNFATAQLPTRTGKGIKAPDQMEARDVRVPNTTSKSSVYERNLWISFG